MPCAVALPVLMSEPCSLGLPAFTLPVSQQELQDRNRNRKSREVILYSYKQCYIKGHIMTISFMAALPPGLKDM